MPLFLHFPAAMPRAIRFSHITHLSIIVLIYKQFCFLIKPMKSDDKTLFDLAAWRE
jgi:hypothetical protein